jgi:hypothetical protein
MGFADWWDENIQGPAEDAWNWLGKTPDGPKSDIGPADRNNFNLPGAGDRANHLNQLANDYGNRVAPQAGDSAFRNDQAALINRLRNQMNGADSLAQMQFRRATDANTAQQRSLAAGAGPGNAAMMARLASQNIGRMNQGYGQQAAMLGIQERNAAANALGGVAGQARGQDLGLSQFNAGAKMQQTQMNDQAAAAARQQELANAQLMQQGSMGYESNQTQRYGIDKGVPQQPANWERVVGAAGALAPLAMLSDERQKTHVQPFDDGADRLINKLEGYKFEYKDPAYGQGQRTGVMAQDVEQGGPMGQAMVHDHGGMKQIDMPQAVGTTLGLIGRLGERLDRLEGKPKMMAQGGIVTRPTDAVVGEAGPEYIMPLGGFGTSDQERAVNAGMGWDFLPKLALPKAEDHTMRDSFIRSSAQSQDPVVRGLSGITQAIAMKHDKNAAEAKEDREINDPVLKMIKARSPRDAVSAGIKPQEPGYYPMDMWRPMATGGLVTQPTRAIIGEAGPEAVIPLRELPGLIDRLQEHAGSPTAVARTRQTAGVRPGGEQPRADIIREGETRNGYTVLSPEEIARRYDPTTTYGPPKPSDNYGPPKPSQTDVTTWLRQLLSR